MRALVLYGANDFGVENDWKTPVAEPGWALVKVRFSGVCGSDLPRFFETGSYHSPMIIGHECSGIVERPAEGGKIPAGAPVAVLPIIPCGKCDGCRRTGEPFHCERYRFIGSRDDGGFAQFCAVKDENMLLLQSNEQLKAGALIEPLAVGLHAVRRSGFTGGKAIVFGAGPIGLACALWLEHLKADATIVDVRDYSLETARSLGIGKCRRFDDIGDERFDFAFEASGSGAALQKSIEVLDRKGSLTTVGRNTGDTVLPASLFERFMRKEITLSGCWGYNLGQDEALIWELINSRPIEKMISHVVSLSDSVNTLKSMYNKSVNYCKVLIDMEMDR